MNSVIAGLLTTLTAALVSVLVSYLTHLLTRQREDTDYKLKKAEELYIKIGFYSANIRDYYSLLIDAVEKMAEGKPGEIQPAEEELREKLNREEEAVLMLTEIYFGNLIGVLRNITQCQSSAFTEYYKIEKRAFKETRGEYIKQLASNHLICVDYEKEFKGRLIAKVNEMRGESVLVWLRNLHP
jgi:hypothetical protein